MVFTTTLNDILNRNPCSLGYDLLKKNLGPNYGMDTPITLRQIYQSNGPEDMFWAIRLVPDDYGPMLRNFACQCAEDVQHLIRDTRSRNAIKISKLFSEGCAYMWQLDNARVQSWDAVRSAHKSDDRVAKFAAKAAAFTTTHHSHDSALDASWFSAKASAKDSARQMQSDRLLRIFGQ